MDDLYGYSKKYSMPTSSRDHGHHVPPPMPTSSLHYGSPAGSGRSAGVGGGSLHPTNTRHVTGLTPTASTMYDRHQMMEQMPMSSDIPSSRFDRHHTSNDDYSQHRRLISDDRTIGVSSPLTGPPHIPAAPSIPAPPTSSAAGTNLEKYFTADELKRFNDYNRFLLMSSAEQQKKFFLSLASVEYKRFSDYLEMDRQSRQVAAREPMPIPSRETISSFRNSNNSGSYGAVSGTVEPNSQFNSKQQQFSSSYSYSGYQYSTDTIPTVPKPYEQEHSVNAIKLSSHAPPTLPNHQAASHHLTQNTPRRVGGPLSQQIPTVHSGSGKYAPTSVNPVASGSAVNFSGTTGNPYVTANQLYQDTDYTRATGAAGGQFRRDYKDDHRFDGDSGTGRGGFAIGMTGKPYHANNGNNRLGSRSRSSRSRSPASRSHTRSRSPRSNRSRSPVVRRSVWSRMGDTVSDGFADRFEDRRKPLPPNRASRQASSSTTSSYPHSTDFRNTVLSSSSGKKETYTKPSSKSEISTDHKKTHNNKVLSSSSSHGDEVKVLQERIKELEKKLDRQEPHVCKRHQKEQSSTSKSSSTSAKKPVESTTSPKKRPASTPTGKEEDAKKAKIATKDSKSVPAKKEEKKTPVEAKNLATKEEVPAKKKESTDQSKPTTEIKSYKIPKKAAKADAVSPQKTVPTKTASSSSGDKTSSGKKESHSSSGKVSKPITPLSSSKSAAESRTRRESGTSISSSNRTSSLPRITDEELMKELPNFQWCNMCHQFFETTAEFLRHVHRDRHYTRLSSSDFAIIKKAEEKINADPSVKDENQLKTSLSSSSANSDKSTDQVDVTKTQFLGTEFIYPLVSYYCDLCTKFLSTQSQAQTHLRSERHLVLYKKYTKKNVTFYKEFNEDRMEEFKTTPFMRQLMRNWTRRRTDTESSSHDNKRSTEKRLEDEVKHVLNSILDRVVSESEKSRSKQSSTKQTEKKPAATSGSEKTTPAKKPSTRSSSTNTETKSQNVALKNTKPNDSTESGKKTTETNKKVEPSPVSVPKKSDTSAPANMKKAEPVSKTETVGKSVKPTETAPKKTAATPKKADPVPAKTPTKTSEPKKKADSVKPAPIKQQPKKTPAKPTKKEIPTRVSPRLRKVYEENFPVIDDDEQMAPVKATTAANSVKAVKKAQSTKKPEKKAPVVEVASESIEEEEEEVAQNDSDAETVVEDESEEDEAEVIDQLEEDDNGDEGEEEEEEDDEEVVVDRAGGGTPTGNGSDDDDHLSPTSSQSTDDKNDGLEEDEDEEDFEILDQAS